MAGSIDWTHRAEHIAKHGLTPELANEAAADPRAVVIDPDPASKTGKSVRIIGYARSVDQVLVVIVVPDGGHLWGASAWPANTTNLNLYLERNRNE